MTMEWLDTYQIDEALDTSVFWCYTENEQAPCLLSTISGEVCRWSLQM